MDFRIDPKDLSSWKPTAPNSRSERRFSVTSALIKASLRYEAANDLGQVSISGELTMTGGLLRPAVRFDFVSATYTEGSERAQLQHEIISGSSKSRGKIDWDDRKTVSALHLPFLVEALVQADVDALEFLFFDGRQRRRAVFERRSSMGAKLLVGKTAVLISLKDYQIQDFEFRLLGFGSVKFRAQE